MPEFHEREPEHQEWKRKVLSGQIELEEMDTATFPDRSPARPTLAPDGTRVSPNPASG
jgi:hypothetical protein